MVAIKEIYLGTTKVRPAIKWTLYKETNFKSSSWGTFRVDGWEVNNSPSNIGFNTTDATWDLTNGSGGTEAGSQSFYGWSLDGTQNIPITWTPQTWSTPPTGTIEIRVER